MMKFFRRLLVGFFVLVVLVFLSFFSLSSFFYSSKEIVVPSFLASVPQTPFRFAVLTDIHSDWLSLEQALERVKEDGVEFIIVAGDLTTLGGLAELRQVKSILDESGLVYFVIPGNHDLYSAKGNYSPFEIVFGADYQAFEKGKLKFILINNGDEVVGLDKEQLAWLRQELPACLELYCLVFAHMPLNHSFLGQIMGEDSLAVASQAAELVGLFNSFQVKELFAGHLHYLSSYEIDGLKTTIAGALYSQQGTITPKFLEVVVYQPRVELEKKEVWLE